MADADCGREITTDTTLEGDLTCESGPALVIAADNVTLDLGGHTISGQGGQARGAPGILLRGVSGATVRNGTVQNFGAGVVVEGGRRNLVQNVIAQDNVGDLGSDFGDGIVVNNSNDNRIEGNTVVRNGPYSGIALPGHSQHNEVRHNVVMDNNMLQTGDPAAGRQDMGIRVEGPVADHNTVESNTVIGSGAEGIVVLPTCVNPDSSPPCVGSPANRYNRIVRNTSMRNGTSGRGDGIKLLEMPKPVGPAHNTIAENFANGNTTCGISVDGGASNNKVVRNSAHGNGRYDGYDGNTDPACDTSTWETNDFGSVNQPCVTGQAMPTAPSQPAEIIEVDEEMVERGSRRNLGASRTG